MAMTTALDTGGDTGQEHDEPFRLLELPPELWVKIGKMAVDEAAQSVRDYAEKIKSEGNFGAWPWTRSKVEQNKRFAQPAITKACRVLRQELLPYHYEVHVPLAIFGDLANWQRDRLNRWLLVIGRESRKKIQRPYLMFDEKLIGSDVGAVFEFEEQARAFFFAGQVSAEIGAPVATTDTPKVFQEYLLSLGESCYDYNCAWTITFH